MRVRGCRCTQEKQYNDLGACASTETCVQAKKTATNKLTAMDQTICPENKYNEYIYSYFIYSYTVSATIRNVELYISTFLRHAKLRSFTN